MLANWKPCLNCRNAKVVSIDGGAANRVSFDPLKEWFVVIRRQKPLGEDFKLLGVTFDAQLLMYKGVQKLRFT